MTTKLVLFGYWLTEEHPGDHNDIIMWHHSEDSKSPAEHVSESEYFIDPWGETVSFIVSYVVVLCLVSQPRVHVESWPETTVQDCVHTSVRVEPLDVSSGHFQAVFVETEPEPFLNKHDFS